MPVNNEGSSSKKSLTKYCLECKEAFCDDVLTCKVIKSKSGKPEIINSCPNCGSDNMFYIKMDKSAGPQA